MDAQSIIYLFIFIWQTLGHGLSLKYMDYPIGNHELFNKGSLKKN